MTIRDYELKRKWDYWYKNKVWNEGKICYLCESMGEHWVWIDTQRLCCACFFATTTLEQLDRQLDIDLSRACKKPEEE